MSERALLISSLLLFHPILAQDSVLATIATLMGHFINICIIWLLNRRKFTEQQTSGPAPSRAGESQLNPRLLMVSLLVLGAIFLAIDRGSRIVGLYLSYIIVWNSLVLIHFYVTAWCGHSGILLCARRLGPIWF